MTRVENPKVWAALVVAAMSAAAIVVVVVVVVVVVALVAGTKPAKAAFPGSNGAIAYVHAGQQVYRMGSDGYPQTQLSSDSAGTSSFSPNWSANGKKIVFVNAAFGDPDISWMNFDGTGRKLSPTTRGISTCRPPSSPTTTK